MPTLERIISLRNLQLSYRMRKQLFCRVKRQVHALKDVSFDVFRGEKLGIIGRNGCGKSTLFKVLADIFEPDNGTIDVVEGLKG